MLKILPPIVNKIFQRSNSYWEHICHSVNEKYSILLEFGKVSYKISTTLDHYMGKIEGWRIIGIHWTLLSSILVNNLWIKKRHKNLKHTNVKILDFCLW